MLTALDALAIAPEKFTVEAGIYLGLRSIIWQLTRAKTDDALRDVVGRLWNMAVVIEDGNVSDAEAALRAAQEALRQALERGASEEEIKKLTDQLRAALDKFLQALAEEMRKNPQRLARPMDPNLRNLRPQDLKSMIDRLENLARSGAKDAAQQAARGIAVACSKICRWRVPGQMDGDDGDDMMSALDELGDMIRKQQQLRDRTFRQGQDQRRERQRGQRGERASRRRAEYGRAAPGSAGTARAIPQAARAIAPARHGPAAGRAGSEGQQAAKWISSAAPAKPWARPKASSAKAIPTARSMRRAARSRRCARARKAWRNRCSSNRAWAPVPASPAAGNNSGQGRTPIRSAGRCAGAITTMTNVKVPGEIDVQRARRILEELRRRFADPLRPQIELDYLERLLKDF